MATAPQPPHRPPPPPPPKTRADDHPPPAVGGGHLAKTGDDKSATDDRPTIGVRGEPIEDGSRDPGTIAEEQRRRSAEIEAMGVEAWKDAHDTRSAEDKARSHSPVVEGGEHKRVENHKAP
jgi:hypothetical protein